MTTDTAAATNDPQALTLENVERTLDELRPCLLYTSPSPRDEL